MTDNRKSFTEKLSNFIFGEPVPVLGDQEIEAIQAVSRKMDALLEALNSHPDGSRSGGSLNAASEDTEELRRSIPLAGSVEKLDELLEQVRKLAKTQYKANTLQESQLAQQQETLASFQASIRRHEEQAAEQVEAAQLEMSERLLPVLDSLDAAFDSGRRQVLRLSLGPESRRAVIAWLDGIRLARARLLNVLAAYDVTPIEAVGQPFDPHCHVAVATDSSGRSPDGVIVGEDRRGYATPSRVLREAEVVVARSG